MQIVFKHQLKTTTFTSLSRAFFIFKNLNFTSLNNIKSLNNHKQNHSNSIDLDNFDNLIKIEQSFNNGSIYNSYILNKIISSCAYSRSLYLGIQIHSFVIKTGFCSNVYVTTSLVDMYGKCGVISDARKVFDEMPERNVVTWNSLIAGYLCMENLGVLVELFVEMVRLGVGPSEFTVSSVIVACSRLEALKLGEEIYCFCVKSGFVNVVVGTALLEMYWKCCDVDDSRRVFDDLTYKNVVTWTSMITGYAQNGRGDNAMCMIKEMLNLGHKADHITYNSLLTSFCNVKDMIHREQIHCRVIKEGLESDMYIAISLVTVYSQCGGSLKDFYKICSTVDIKNSISCNAIISGFSNLGSCKEALNLFSEMRQAGTDIDFFTIASVLKVIGAKSAVEEGRQVHGLIVKSAYDSNIYIQNGLISMYSRIGKIDEAKWMFSSMVEHDTISWNSLLSGYAQHGYGKEIVEAFEQMTETKVKPDLATFLIMLSACSHVGRLDKGLEYFDLMRNDGSLEPPKVEHYACIVDLYARAGYLNEAEEVINTMPIEAGPSVYRALLSACRVHGDNEIGVRVARKFVDRFPDEPAAYVQLSYILAKNGYWDDSAEAHSLMFDKGIKKNTGCSWI